MKLYREKIYDEIIESYDSGSLAPSLLFSGPAYSGRLSMAMDLAKHIGLEDIVFFPSRDLSLEIEAAYNLVKEKYSSRFIGFFSSRIKLLLLQYHPSLLSLGAEGAKDKLFSQAADISEMLYVLSSLNAEEDRDKIEKLINDIYTLAKRPDIIYKGKKRGSITVDDVRCVQNYLATKSGKCMVIIENIEDSTDSARNALLKTLEEPFADSYFVLISSNSLRILNTILSRVRKYSFSPLNGDLLNDYLKHEFLCEKEYESYGDFLFEQSTEKEIRESIISAANRYESAIVNGRMPSVDELDEIYSSLDKRTSYFISLVLKALRRDFLTGSLKAKKAFSILKAIDDASLSNAVYNQNIKSAFDLALREAMSVD